NNLTYEKQGNGDIVFRSKISQSVIYRMQAPFMVDASGKVSKAVSFNITAKDGVLYGELVADSTWLKAGERRYPVIIDPTIYINTGVSAYSTENKQDYYLTNDNNLAEVYSSNYSDTGKLPTTEIAYFKFDKVNIGQDQRINQANLLFFGELTPLNVNGQVEKGTRYVRLNTLSDENWELTQSKATPAPEIKLGDSLGEVQITKDENNTDVAWFNVSGAVNKYEEFKAALSLVDDGIFKVSSFGNAGYRPTLLVEYDIIPPDPPVIEGYGMDPDSGEAKVYGRVGADADTVDLKLSDGVNTVTYTTTPIDGSWEIEFSLPDEGKQYYISVAAGKQGRYSKFTSPVRALRYAARDSNLNKIANFYYEYGSTGNIYGVPYTDVISAGDQLLMIEPDYMGVFSPRLFRPYSNRVPATYGRVANTAYNADPVNSTTGNLTHEETDIKVPDLGSPLEFTRTYNSVDSYNGPLGYGWSYTYNSNLLFLSDGSIAVINGDGRWDTYQPTGDGKYASPQGVTSTLEASGDNTFSVKTKDKTIYKYDNYGLLKSITDKNDNSTTFAYSSRGLLEAVTDPAGRTLGIGWVDKADPNNPGERFKIETVTDPSGGVYTYHYENSNL
ncbi:MAG TPA: RHS repeat domain-containing protein, partial [Verrucomicrobiae bacterium]|nr:RHS repeat domain-containing protein [Verrucomicrobiae bacterium]